MSINVDGRTALALLAASPCIAGVCPSLWLQLFNALHDVGDVLADVPQVVHGILQLLKLQKAVSQRHANLHPDFELERGSGAIGRGPSAADGSRGASRLHGVALAFPLPLELYVLFGNVVGGVGLDAAELVAVLGGGGVCRRRRARVGVMR